MQNVVSEVGTAFTGDVLYGLAEGVIKKIFSFFTGGKGSGKGKGKGKEGGEGKSTGGSGFFAAGDERQFITDMITIIAMLNPSFRDDAWQKILQFLEWCSLHFSYGHTLAKWRKISFDLDETNRMTVQRHLVNLILKQDLIDQNLGEAERQQVLSNLQSTHYQQVISFINGVAQNWNSDLWGWLKRNGIPLWEETIRPEMEVIVRRWQRANNRLENETNLLGHERREAHPHHRRTRNEQIFAASDHAGNFLLGPETARQAQTRRDPNWQPPVTTQNTANRLFLLLALILVGGGIILTITSRLLGWPS